MGSAVDGVPGATPTISGLQGGGTAAAQSDEQHARRTGGVGARTVVPARRGGLGTRAAQGAERDWMGGDRRNVAPAAQRRGRSPPHTVGKVGEAGPGAGDSRLHRRWGPLGSGGRAGQRRRASRQDW